MHCFALCTVPGVGVRVREGQGQAFNTGSPAAKRGRQFPQNWFFVATHKSYRVTLETCPDSIATKTELHKFWVYFMWCMSCRTLLLWWSWPPCRRPVTGWGREWGRPAPRAPSPPRAPWVPRAPQAPSAIWARWVKFTNFSCYWYFRFNVRVHLVWLPPRSKYIMGVVWWDL